MNMEWGEVLKEIESLPDVHSAHPDKWTIVFLDGNHIHLDTYSIYEEHLTKEEAYKLWLCANI
jgi:hypothetical protein